MKLLISAAILFVSISSFARTNCDRTIDRLDSAVKKLTDQQDKLEGFYNVNLNQELREGDMADLKILKGNVEISKQMLRTAMFQVKLECK